MKMVLPQFIAKAGWVCCVDALSLILLFQNAFSQTDSALRILQSDGSSITFRIDIPSVNFHQDVLNNQHYLIPSVSGYLLSAEPGQPALPQKAFHFGAPPGAHVRLEILDMAEKVEGRRTGVRIAPAPSQQSKALGKTNHFEPEFSEGGNYNRQTWVPSQIVRLIELGYLRDQRLVSITVSPVQYRPATSEVRVYRSLTIRLTFEHTARTELTLPSQDTRLSPKTGAQFESLLQNSIVNYEQSKCWRSALTGETASSKEGYFDPISEYYKLEIENDGIYQVTGEDLQNAGVDITAISPSTIKIYNKGKQIPIKVVDRKDRQFDLGDTILFYGQFNRGDRTYLSPYTKTNVYWLTWGGEKGLRMAEVEGGLFESDPAKFVQPRNAKSTQHFEQDWWFDRLLLIEDEQADHWFWQRMDAFQTYEFHIQLTSPDSLGNLVTVRIGLQGSTHPPAGPDHHVIAVMNGYPIGEALWDGQTEFLIENRRVPSEILHGGDNLLELKLPGDTEAGEVDQVFFNWLEVEYDRLLQAENDYLKISWGRTGLVQFTASGFRDPDIQIFDQFGRTISNFQLTKSNSAYSLVFQDSPEFAANTYFLFTPEAYQRPGSITRDVPSSLKSNRNGADYVIITHRDFQNALLPLVQHRTGQGLRVKTVDVQDIYDEFSHGIYDPRAIKAFLKYAYFNWLPPAPTYVLLVGDHHFGYDKEVGRSWEGRSFVPTYMAYTVSWGATSSDNFFVTVSGEDPIPDMFIGRFPVNTIEETETIVNKIVKYENNPNFGDWRRNLAISVGNRAFFEQHADVLEAELIPSDFDVPRLYTNPESPYFGSTEELVDIFNRGTSMINFIGHGGGGVFADAELFLLEDLVLLDNADHLPVILSWSCFIGYFDDPFAPSLGEVFLRTSERGGVAHFGSSGRAWLFGDFFFNQALFNSLFLRKNRILGQATTEAKIELVSNLSIYKDMVENYILLGDPALRIGFPEKDITIQIENPAVVEGDTLHISGSLEEPLDGTVKLSFFDQQDSLITNSEVTADQGEFRADEEIQAFSKGPKKVKAYFWNETLDGSGMGIFTVERRHFSAGQLFPPNPTHLDDVYLFTKLTQSPLADSLMVEEVFCQWSLDRSNWNHLTLSPFEDGYKSDATITIFETTTLFYRFFAKIRRPKAVKSDTVRSHLFLYHVPARADLTIAKESVSVGGTEETFLTLEVGNRGETDAVRVPISVYALSENPQLKTAVTRKSLRLLRAESDTLLSLSWPDEIPDFEEIEIVLDEDNRIDESSEFNNSVQIPIRFLTRSKGTDGPAFSADSHFVVTIPPQSIDKNTSFSLQRLPNQTVKIAGAGLAPVSLGGVYAAYVFTLADSQVVFEKDFKIAFKVDLGDSSSAEVIESSDIAIYYHKDNTWMQLNTELNLNNHEILSAGAFGAGMYSLFAIEDTQPPSITVKVNGQWFTDGDYVAANPEFSVVLADSSGVSLFDNSLKLSLDKVLVPKEDYSLGFAGERSTHVLLNYAPTIASGNHTLAVMAEDIHGNFTESAIDFEVSSDFQLMGLANHPNPFSDEAILAYTLTNEAQVTEIKIYTVSGRLIRVFEFFNEVGYVEHVWDGTDDLGHDIANGVYYMRFVAKRGSDRIEQIQKMAKAR